MASVVDRRGGPRLRRLLGVVVPLLFGLTACGTDADESSAENASSAGVAEQLAEEVVPDASTLCEAITASAIDEVTGAEVVAVEGGDGTCRWSLSGSAAALDGPNEGGEPYLEAAFIPPGDVEAARDVGGGDDVDVVPVDDVGDDAVLVRRDGTPPTTIYVLVGDEAFRIALANVLDGAHATEQALTDLSALVIASL